MINWIDPENEMPEKNLYSFPIELTNSKGEKLIVSGKFDDATTKWLDDDGYELECGGWKVTGWMPLPEPRQPVKNVRWVNFYDSAHPSEHHTRETADSYDDYCDNINRIACIRVEFEGGEGL